MKSLILYILVFFVSAACGDSVPRPPSPYGPVPSEAQLRWHEMEMYCLIHYGVDTYTDKEWGYGDEDPAIVNPTGFDAGQIVEAAKAGGFKGVIVVAKHHDGLCLWPTKTTEHNISKSPWKNGRGDMIKEYQLACDKLGMKLGLYCSPWDRNSAAYGTEKYPGIYREQLKELFSNYGSLFISWHDGANGGDGFYGGARERRNIDRTSYYGWDLNFAITRKMQPSAVIFGDIGPDVRWVGNEEGHAGETCWATYSPEAPDKGQKPANGYSKYWLATEGTKSGKYWMPAECDVPLRPGWFYHPSQDGQAKSAYTLLDLCYKSVGRGAGLDLGLAPNREGLLPADDVKVLKEFGKLLETIFWENLVKDAVFSASNVRGNSDKYSASLLKDDDRYSYWATDDNILTPELTVDLKVPKTFNVIRLRENIKLGQRITSFAVDAFINNQWLEIAAATSIGANRLIRLPQNITAKKIRLRITGAEACIALSDFGLFKEPPHLTAPVIRRDKQGTVQILTNAPVAAIHYTTDGTEPTTRSPRYSRPFTFAEGGIVKARNFEANGEASEISSQQFGLSKADWKITAYFQPDTDNQAALAIDENDKTIFAADNAGFPGEVIIDMGKVQPVKAFTYLPRQDKKQNGIADKYIFWISDNGTDWKEAAKGEFANIRANPVGQNIILPEIINTRFFKFSVVHVISGSGISIAELGVLVK